MTSDDPDPIPVRRRIHGIPTRRWFQIGAAAAVILAVVMISLLVQHLKQLERNEQFSLMGQVERGVCMGTPMQWALQDIGPQYDAEVRSLIRVLESEQDRRIRKSAILALYLIGDAAIPAVPALLTVASSGVEDARLRSFAITVLATRADVADTIAPVMADILTSDADVFVIADAAMALHRLGASTIDAVPPLARALRSSYLADRARAAEVLGLLGPESAEAVPLLADLVQDSDSRVRLSAIAALGRLGAESWKAVPDLIGALEDGNLDIRLAAARALGDIGPDARPAIPALVRMLGTRRTWTPPSGESDAGRPLRYVDPHGEYCGRVSLSAPFDIRSRDASQNVPPIVAADALGAIGAAAVEAIPALTEAAYDQRTNIRRAAGRALDTIAGAR